MITLEMPANEAKRIQALKRFHILDTPPDGSFDRITQLASTIFSVPISIISLVDTDRIWFKSHHGLSIDQINRDPGLCASAILSDDTYIIENASEDPRSLANPLVAGEFGLRFYAAVPLQTEDYFNLGTLCIIDKSPRIFTDKEKEILKQLAKIVMDEMELRLAMRQTVTTIRNLTGDLTAHLEDTVLGLEGMPAEDQKNKIVSYLDATTVYLQNIENQLNHL